MNQCQDNWYKWLCIAEFAYNDQVHASTCSSLFMMDTGQNPQLGIEPLRDSHPETLNNFASRIEAATKEVCLSLARAADDMASFYNAHLPMATVSMSQTLPANAVLSKPSNIILQPMATFPQVPHSSHLRWLISPGRP